MPSLQPHSRRRLAWSASLIAAVALVLGGLAAPANAATAITGTISRADSARTPATPVAGATVELLTGTGTSFSPIRTTTSDANGTYSLSVEDGSYEVRVTAPGYDATTVGPFTAPTSAPVNASISKANPEVSGTVVDSSGRPVQGVSVYAYTRTVSGSTGSPTYTPALHSSAAKRATTAADGTFVFDLAPGTWIFGFEAAAFQTAYYVSNGTTADPATADEITVVKGAGLTLGTVSLGSATAVTGTLTNGGNQPLSGVTVTPVAYDDLGRWKPATALFGADPSVQTDSTGFYVLPVPPAAVGKPFRLRFEATGRTITYYPSQTDPNSASDLTVSQGQVVTGRDDVVRTLARISGTVTEADGSTFLGKGTVSAFRRISYRDGGSAGGTLHSRWELVQTSTTNATAHYGVATVSDTGSFVLTVPQGTYRLRYDSAQGPDPLTGVDPLVGSAAVTGEHGFLPGLSDLGDAPDVTVGVDGALTNQVYAMPGRFFVRGTVTNDVSSPVGGALVSAQYRKVVNQVDGTKQYSTFVAPTLTGAGTNQPSRQATTDGTGHYDLAVYAGDYKIGACQPAAGSTTCTPGVYYPSASVVDAGADVSPRTADVTGIDLRLPAANGVTNTRLPWVSGLNQQGQTLTADPGTWAPADVTFGYQWQSNPDPSVGTNTWSDVTGATAKTYAIPSGGLLGGGSTSAYRVVVTATRSGSMVGTATSQATGKAVGGGGILGGGSPDIENRRVPYVDGVPAVGQTLTTDGGQWSKTTGTFTYQWYAGGALITGATAATYTLTPAELGKTVRVRVTETGGSTPAGGEVVDSALTSTVVPGGLVNTARPTIAGDPRVGSDLTASPGTWNGTGLTFDYQWFANGQAVTGATKRVYTPVDGDTGTTLTVRVTASGTGYTSGVARSAPTSEVIGDLNDPTKVFNTAKPTVTGTPKVGATLTATDGQWTNAPTGFAYQWFGNGVAITGATSKTFTPSVDDLAKVVTVQVTASKSGLTDGQATSDPTAPVAKGTPANTVAPSISGTPSVGSTLTADPGTWTPATGLTFAYQWFGDGTAITGATARTLVLGDQQSGQRITVAVTASGNGYDPATATSAAVGPVAGLPPVAVASGPSVSGTPSVGQVLTVDPGSYTPGDATVTVQWLRDGAPIAGATARSYRLVTADAGRSVAAKVTYAAQGYSSTTRTSASQTVRSTRTKPRIYVQKVRDGHQVMLRFTVLDRQSVPATGRIRVSEGAKVRKIHRLSPSGTATFRIKNLKPGYHVFRVVYLGSASLRKVAKSVSVTVKR